MKQKYLILLTLILFSLSSFAQAPDYTLIVTAERLPVALAETTASVIILEEAEINALGGVAPALRAIAGTQVRQNGVSSAVATYSIRSSTASQILVLVDGLPISNAQMPDQDFTIIPTETVERIEVLKGPASALYGANAIGGVVNIITKKIEKPISSLELATNSFGSFAGSYLLEAWGDQFDWALATSGSKGEGHLADSQYQKGNIWLKAQGAVWDDYLLTATLNHYQDDKSLPSPFGAGQQKDRQNRLALSLDADPIQANLIYKDYWQDYNDEWTNSEHKNQGIYLDGQYMIPSKPLIFGGTFAWDRAESTDLGPEAKELVQAGVFLQHKGDLPLGRLRTNLRYDHHSSFGGFISPSLNLLIPIAEEKSAWVSAAKAFRAPSLNDLYWEDPFMTGNPDLKPEVALSAELGLRQFKEGRSLELVGFWRQVDDYIVWVPTGDPMADPWIVGNHGDHLFYGFEASSSVPLADNIFLSLSYTYTEGENKTENTRALFTPKHNVHGAIDFTSGKFTVGLTGSYHSKQTADTYGTTLPERFVLGCYLSYPLSSGSITLRVDNLLDAEYQEQTGYPMPPRHFTLSFKQTF